MKKLLFLLILCSLTSDYKNLMAWDTTAAKYLPLQVGNVWVYNGYHEDPITGPTYFRDRYQITGTIQMNGKTYYIVSRRRIVLSGINPGGEYSGIRLFKESAAIRIDSASMNVYKNRPCGSSFELLIDSLMARRNDSSNTCDLQGNWSVCTDTSMVTIFGLSRQSKVYSVCPPSEGCNNQTYVKEFGISQYWWSQHGETATYNLRGCLINGILYGDTTLTGLIPISNEIPSGFKLYQNYPNPFNPVTRVRFSVPLNKGGERGLYIRLLIFDLLGREIATLVNESLQPGTYEVEWNAAEFPSGVYYYRLIAGDYSETKKMILIK
jgi:hypothetical protein